MSEGYKLNAICVYKPKNKRKSKRKTYKTRKEALTALKKRGKRKKG